MTGETTETRVRTRRQIIRAVADAWKRQYYHAFTGEWGNVMDRSAKVIYDHLAALDLTTVSADEVTRVIGNDSWTENECDGCGADVEAVVLIGDEDYDCGQKAICKACATVALQLLTEARS